MVQVAPEVVRTQVVAVELVSEETELHLTTSLQALIHCFSTLEMPVV
jgi:hypothetical protein